MLSIAPLDAAYQTYSPGLPISAATDEISTIAPPAPPLVLEIRGIAARAHQNAPMTLRSITSRNVCVLTSSTREFFPVMPLL